jgi:hypothetical protein
MNTPHYLKRIIAGAVLSGSLAVTAVGLAAGTAQANTRGPYQWCPGQHFPETDVVPRRIWGASPGWACPGCNTRNG